MGARRLADKHPNSRSLYQLLQKIKDNATLITKEWYLQRAQNRLTAIDRMELMTEPEYDKLWKGKEELKESTIRDIKAQIKEQVRREIEQEFVQTWAGKCGTHLDPSVVEKDIALLEEKYEALKAFVDRVIAHIDPKQSQVQAPSDGEIEEFYSTVEHLLNKYSELLTGATMLSFTPTIVNPWKQEFEVAWSSQTPLPVEREEQQKRLSRLHTLDLPEEHSFRLEALQEKREWGEQLTEEEERELTLLEMIVDELVNYNLRQARVPERLGDREVDGKDF